MLSEEKKHSVLAQIKAVLEGETDMIARMANAAALLHEGFGFWWTGFYRVLPTSGIKTGARTEKGSGTEKSVWTEKGAGIETGARTETDTGVSETGAELVLGPFQGPVACQRIAFGRGVCGTAWKEARTIVVPDVEQFPGHIACSSESRSEVVVPLFGRVTQNRAEGCVMQTLAEGSIAQTQGSEAGGSRARQEVFAVLDIDSRELATFDESDVPFLEEVAKVIASEANV